MAEPTEADRETWSRMPLSAPRWAWLLYGVATAALAWVATHGGTAAGIAVAMEGTVSFQFWTYAAFRGRIRRAAEGASQ